ncbi:MAG: hypothetical protein MUF81_03315 [Verrucomicrobia bacterium]|jgi:uncharacterized repeat protein (TIGR03803 family)|nr:hypothetical protein [Verrucomicrobiota bacterium]
MRRIILVLHALIPGFGLFLANCVTAQIFTTLHSFAGPQVSFVGGYPVTANSDGAVSQAALILSGATLYGTTMTGGSFGRGTVFAMNFDGTGFTNLHSFAATAYFDSGSPNSDGSKPYANLILSGSTLYGTAKEGGDAGYGTFFCLSTNGTGFTNLHSFPFVTNFLINGEGANPYSDLVLSGGILYGAASIGGPPGGGTVFAIHTNGTGFTNLHSFIPASDGNGMQAGLVVSGGKLYGTANYGGSSGNGTIFAINTDGTGFTNLHNFAASVGSPPFKTNSDGANPQGGLILSGNTLYGMTLFGGSSGSGTVFAMNTDGTGFTNLYKFSAVSNSPDGALPNSDGAIPYGRLVLSGNTLYGTTSLGGSSGRGTIFAINTDGSDFTTLYTFSALSNSTNSDGARPQAGLILSGRTLYGTTPLGGTSGNGTLFSLSLQPPQLKIVRSETNVVLTWPANAAGFVLQSAPAITGQFTNLPSATSPYTNSITGVQQFFRLISN